MTREDRIKQGILSLDTGDYQALVSDYLTRSLGYARVIALGMKPGTHKTRAGTPDTFYHIGSHCVLMEAGTYTKRRDAEVKIRQDVKKCTDYRDNHPELIVDGIVIAYTCTSIDPPDLLGIERDNEGVELLGLDALAFGLLRYPWLVEEHLQIPMLSSQVLDLDTFVSKMERDPFSACISNRMIGREAEVRHIRQCIDGHKSVLVVGQSGVGKTKLALGAVISTLRDDPDATAWCVRSLKRDLYKDMQIALEGSKGAIILVDDIDGVFGLRPFLELCKEYDARVVATVRSSVLAEVKGEMRVLGGVEELEVFAPAPSEQHAILRDSFGIRSIDDRTAIISKSRGNLRFAQLVAEALEKGKLEFANDPHELVAGVYGPLLSHLDESQEKVLEVLALLGAARLGDGVLGWLLEEWGLDSRRFLTACRALSHRELVSLTSLESAASIVEQNLTDFLIYRTLFEERRVGIVELLEHGAGARRLCKYVEVLCGVYRSDESVEFASGCVRVIWNTKPTFRAFLCERMGFLLRSKREAYVVQKIQEIALHCESAGDVEVRVGLVRHVLACLAGMRGEAALSDEYAELFLELVDATVPHVSQLGEFMDAELSFSCGEIASDKSVKIRLISSLGERYEQSGNVGYADALLRYAKSLLSDVVTRVRPSIGKTSYSNAELVMSPDVVEVRAAVVSALASLVADPNLRESVVDLYGSYSPLWDGASAGTRELQNHTARLIADNWSSWPSPTIWHECITLCDFLDDWEGQIGEACVAKLLPKGSPQGVVRFIRGDGILDSGAKAERDSRLERIINEVDVDTLLMPFDQFDGAWHCYDRSLLTGFATVLQVLERKSHEGAVRFATAFVESGFKPSRAVTAALFATLAKGLAPKESRERIRLLSSDSRGGSEIAEQWLQEHDYHCIVCGTMRGVAQDIAQHALSSGLFLDYREVSALDAEAKGFGGEYLARACGEQGFTAGQATTFLHSADEFLGCGARQVLAGDSELLAALESLVLKAMSKGDVLPHGLFSSICAADGAFVDKVTDLVLEGGGYGSEDALAVVWALGHDGSEARHVVERVCTRANDPYILPGAHRSLLAVFSSMPEDDVLRNQMVSWLSEFAMRSGRPDEVVCEAVSSAMLEDERVRFIVGMIDHGLSCGSFSDLCMFYDPDCCFTGSEVSRVDDNIRFLENLAGHMHGVRFLEFRVAVDERVERLRVERDSIEAREMVADVV